jgi:hypothetical protein
MPEKEWKVYHHQSGFVSIRGHYSPEYNRVVLLDDIRGIIYRPVGANSFNEVLYNEFPYPVSHNCAVEQEKVDLWAKAEELVMQLAKKGAPDEPSDSQGSDEGD